MWLTWGSVQDSVGDYVRMYIISGHIFLNFCCYHFTCQNNARQTRALMKIITYKMCQKHSNASNVSTVLLLWTMCLGLAGKDICAFALTQSCRNFTSFSFWCFTAAAYSMHVTILHVCFLNYAIHITVVDTIANDAPVQRSCWICISMMKFPGEINIFYAAACFCLWRCKKCGHLNFQGTESMPKA